MSSQACKRVTRQCFVIRVTIESSRPPAWQAHKTHPHAHSSAPKPISVVEADTSRRSFAGCQDRNEKRNGVARDARFVFWRYCGAVTSRLTYVRCSCCAVPSTFGVPCPAAGRTPKCRPGHGPGIRPDPPRGPRVPASPRSCTYHICAASELARTTLQVFLIFRVIVACRQLIGSCALESRQRGASPCLPCWRRPSRPSAKWTPPSLPYLVSYVRTCTFVRVLWPVRCVFVTCMTL